MVILAVKCFDHNGMVTKHFPSPRETHLFKVMLSSARDEQLPAGHGTKSIAYGYSAAIEPADFPREIDEVAASTAAR
jgi:hypothetical protein